MQQSDWSECCNHGTNNSYEVSMGFRRPMGYMYNPKRSEGSTEPQGPTTFTSMCFRTPGLFKAPWCLRSSVEVAGPPSAALH